VVCHPFWFRLHGELSIKQLLIADGVEGTQEVVLTCP